MKYYLNLLLLFVANTLFAQLPQTRIYTLDINRERANKLVFTNPKLISCDKGYNNQPFFTDDGKYILYASNNGNGNTDIYRYDISKKKSKRLTKTSEAEYSPQISMVDEELTCVRVEKDTITQHFYAYNKKGKKGHLFLPDLKSLGYYTWYNGVEMIGLTLPEPFTLTKYNVVTLKADTLATNIGRTFQVRAGKLFYVDKSDENSFKIKVVAKENMRPKKNSKHIADSTVCRTMTDVEDFCIATDGTIYMGRAGKLFAFSTKKNRKVKENEWEEVADFSKFGIKNFYRLAINFDMTKIAIVEYSGKKP